MNNIRVFARQLLKNRLSSLLNIAGLAIGLTGFTYIMLYVENEFSFDKFHSRYADTYRVVKDFVNADGSTVPDATTPPALAKALRTSFEDVETATRISANRGRLYLLQFEEEKFYETKLISVDKEFFNVFGFRFLEGDKVTSLDQVHSIILTKSTADKFFNNTGAVGKTIRMNVNGGTEYVVTGVLEDVPQNSHFTFNIIIPFESRRDPDTNWQQSNFYTYVRLKHGSDPSLLLSNVETLVRSNVPNSIDAYHIQPLADIHLHSNLKWELLPNGDIGYVRMLILIAVFILVIACINYVNLVTARSSDRAKEVGIRKAIGALRSQLVKQFLAESTITVFVSMILAFIIILIAAPQFSLKSELLPWAIPFGLLLSFIAGMYPAVYLSRLTSLHKLQGGNLRKALVVFQFTISSGLIAGTLIVISQLDFMKRKDLGFNKDNVLLVPNVRGGIGTEVKGSWDEAARQVPGVINIARADGILGMNNSVNGIGYAPTNSHITLNFIRIDYDFIPTLEIEMSEGRNFSGDFISDTTAIILNEEAVLQLNLQQPVLGQRLAWDDGSGQTHDVTIVGVAKNFHFTNLHNAISPFGFILEVNNGSNFFIRTSSSGLSKTLAEIEQVWNTYNPGKPFEYTFQDQYIANLHLNDERFEKIFSTFTALAILIACLGLFGLTAFLAESRTKEIGVRKVLGASVTSILQLISKEYAIMILLSLALAFPLAWYIMSSWLLNFAYHIGIGWQLFVISAVISITLAALTISFHAIKVATQNPVKALKAE